MTWVEIWHILPPVKRGQHASDVCGYFMSRSGGSTVGAIMVAG